MSRACRSFLGEVMPAPTDSDEVRTLCSHVGLLSGVDASTSESDPSTDEDP